MKTIRKLVVSFNQEIHQNDLLKFRGAVVSKVGRENILFHNHIDGNSFLYKYPKIQYKIIGGRPSIIALDDGIEELQKLFSEKQWQAQLNEKYLDFTVNKVSVVNHKLIIGDFKNDYRIINWCALNQKNHPIFLKLDSLTEKILMLEKILASNVISFAKGIKWDVNKKIEIIIKNIIKEKNIKFKNVNYRCFDLEFSSNVHLPNYIGLGKHSSMGMGVLF